MSKQRHRRRSQGGTTPETTPQTGSGVAQFSVSDVAQFSMSLDTRQQAGLFALEFGRFWVELPAPAFHFLGLPTRHRPPLGLGDWCLADQEFSQRHRMQRALVGMATWPLLR